jgi:hypothetical protein
MFVMAGHSHPKDGVATLAYVPRIDTLSSPRVIAGLDPAIHDEAQRATSVRSWPLHGLMDARVKPAHDAECVVTEPAHDGER